MHRLPVPADIPVDPSAPDARELLLRELSGPEYTAAQPTLLDRIGQAISEWFQSLTLPSGDGLGGLIPVVLLVLLVIGIVAAFIVWGVPRLNRRSRAADSLFGADERRTAAQLRKDAADAAARGDATAAVLDAFRALARGLQERTVVAVLPGTTAHDFASQGAVAFPDLAADFGRTADGFDATRYASVPGTMELYRSISELDAAVARRSAVLTEAVETP
ncbi:uncharacterized protein DUF4129 [Labedella gwakjiensis]|uniref:DUF4129 domain-containing protein n=1 Tax=Labedella gwakjiensis TaxID=390269 RepID=A0A2P8GXX9_9MICO|nr:DUF4129 domain-containing protein [Labedella gwakjiensis]PSL38819.1 uncharacterized protein DUF4129 [Labedella gwakjiensis]RUQ86710.1 DUF4129 domain-containing protein [Labedella gwakjiensis]